MITYTEFGAKEFHAAGVTTPVTVIPHGITEGQFHPMNKAECRRRLGIPVDGFIVFNGNRSKLVKQLTSPLMTSLNSLLINLTPISICTWG